MQCLHSFCYLPKCLDLFGVLLGLWVSVLLCGSEFHRLLCIV